MKRMMSLLTRLVVGSAEEKAGAREEIERMPSSSPPLTPEEEEAAEAKGKELLDEAGGIQS